MDDRAIRKFYSIVFWKQNIILTHGQIGIRKGNKYVLLNKNLILKKLKGTLIQATAFDPDNSNFEYDEHDEFVGLSLKPRQLEINAEAILDLKEINILDISTKDRNKTFGDLIYKKKQDNLKWIVDEDAIFKKQKTMTQILAKPPVLIIPPKMKIIKKHEEPLKSEKKTRKKTKK